MADFVPFGAVHYNQEKFPKISELVCPSYDMIYDVQKKTLNREFYNFVNLVRAEEDDASRYKHSAQKLYGWLLRDVLVVDPTPGYYVYEEKFILDGAVYERYGVIGLMRLEEYGPKVGKFEKTHIPHLEDRYALLKEIQGNLESVMGLYRDNASPISNDLKESVKTLEPMFEFTGIDQAQYKVYRIDQDTLKTTIRDYFKDKSVILADGHHRYEAALQYQKEMKESLGAKYTGKESFNFILTCLVNVGDPGLKWVPVNRALQKLDVSPKDLLKKLEPYYKLGAIAFTDLKMEKMAREKMRKMLGEYQAKGVPAYGLYLKALPNRYLILESKNPASSVSDAEILEDSVLRPMLGLDDSTLEEKMIFEIHDNRVLDLVKNGDCEAAFLLNMMKPEQIQALTARNSLVSHRSIQVYPGTVGGIALFSYRYSRIGA